jgi:Na+-driven multidrug efflux pump
MPNARFTGVVVEYFSKGMLGAKHAKSTFVCAGFWWGLTIGLFFEGIVYFVVVFKTDWEAEATAVSRIYDLGLDM